MATDRERAETTASRAWARSVGWVVPSNRYLPPEILAAWVRAGRPVVSEVRCSELGCSAVATVTQSPPLCPRCYRRRRRTRGRAAVVGPAPRRATDWKGDAIGYDAAHERVRGAWGAAARYVCNACPARAAEWALMPGRPRTRTERSTGLRYSPSPDDYRPMCKSCHRTQDRRALRLAELLTAAPDGFDLPGLEVAALAALEPQILPLRLFAACGGNS
jgi:hypothetical protein